MSLCQPSAWKWSSQCVSCDSNDDEIQRFFSSTPLSFGAGMSTNDSLEMGGGGGEFSKLENSLSSRLRLICELQLHLEFDDQVRYKCPNFNEVCLRYHYSSDSICTSFQCGKYSLTSLCHILHSSSEWTLTEMKLLYLMVVLLEYHGWDGSENTYRLHSIPLWQISLISTINMSYFGYEGWGGGENHMLPLECN